MFFKYIPFLAILSLLCACQGNINKDNRSYYLSNKESSSLISHIVGTQFPINKRYSMTAAHVTHEMKNKDTIYAIHPKCDVALLIKNRNMPKEFNFSDSKLNENVKVYGYVGTKEEIVFGKIIGYKKISNGDFTKQCEVAIVNFNVKKGMSGSPVFNEKNQIIGVNFATNKDKALSYIVPYESFHEWLNEKIK